ncbi:E3 ubiquitin-protein ligase rnf213-alpha-like [Ylistrum balloti]|uniref:E3 ubiquitin-protein ligase rnf213-alpha-like n=1 Tax=Ylistrum balloti TaxID=509963 RepID=UPI002905E166|nr:E3 ubiquitin-protein ligase rnf213-alpha-like [Ylistrum balloti]
MLDLSAAFDVIDHGTLFKRLEYSYGVTGDALRWTQSYLNERRQCVAIGSTVSDSKTLDFGVRQGSVLVHRKYCLYSKPIGEICRRHNLQYHCYADDTQIYMVIRPQDNWDIIVASLEACLNDISAWMNSNMLKLNQEKTELIVFSHKCQHTKGLHKFDNGSLELMASVFLPRHLQQKLICYTYGVEDRNKEFVAEFVNDTYIANNAERYISMPKSAVHEGIWHQFDGVVYGKLESSFYHKVRMFLKLDDHVKNMRKDAEIMLKHYFDQFLAELQTQNLPPEEFIDFVKSLTKGFSNIYQLKGKLWYSANDFEVFAGKIFQQSSVSFMERIASGGSNVPDHLRFDIVISLVHIIQCYKPFSEKDEKDMELICKLLKLPNLEKDSMTTLIKDIAAHFPKYLKHVTENLQLMNNLLAGKTKNTCWLLVVPLLHFLLGRSTPYQQPSTETEHTKREPVWWGVQEYKKKNDYFAGKSSWNIEFKELLQILESLFEVDYLLPRTLMTVIKLCDMPYAVKSGLFSLDLCIAKLYYFMKSKYLQEKERESRQQILHDMYRLYTISYDLLKLSMDKRYLITSVCVAKIVLQALAVFEESKDMGKEDQTRKNDSLVVYDNFRKDIVCFLRSQCPMHDKYKCYNSLKVWNQMLDVEIPSKMILESFKGGVVEEVEKILTTKRSLNDVVEVYVEHVDEFGSHIQDILSKIAFEALMKGYVNIRYSSHSGKEEKARYARLLSDVFEKHWKGLTEEEMFHEALKWTPFEHFMDMFYLTEQSKHLSEESGIQLTQATTAIQDRMEQLESGHILVKDFSVICANLEKFDRLITMSSIKNNLSLKPEYIKQMVTLRQKELKLFQETYDLVTVFLDMCCRIHVNIETVERQLRDLKNFEKVPVAELCKPGVLTDMMHPDEYQPVVTAFELAQEELDLLPQMKHCFQSLIFTTKWDFTGQKVVKQKERVLSIAETFEHVWQPTLDWWNSVVGKIKQGSMTFKEFNKLFGNMENKELEKEFSSMERNGAWIEERMNQIQLFRDLENCVEGARIILQVVETYKLNGDFGPIELITSVMTGRDIAMKDLDESLRQTCSVLSGVQEKHVLCLQEFIDCEPLILWLKESMPSGLKELKVFVDLATISAGEGDIEIAKVQCLHSATTGYAPLIFNLTDDIGYQGFLDKCKLVWNELEADPNLHKKLHDTNRQIEWLKTVKKAHGSVEVTSLAQTEAINSVGIYQVGRLTDQEWDQKPELKDVISLHVSEDENGARQRKLYHYDQLHDLQSRLMLVAGKAEKGKDDVDRFTLILDSVVRLANTYIKLVSSGCVLFSEWKARFLCDKDRRACCFINFGMGDNRNTLKGRKATNNDDVSSIVPRLAKFMEKCYEQWLQYIADKRDEYYELNYLTIDQMVILQRELVKVGTEQEPDNLIFPLLSMIKKDCSLSDLISAMKAAQREVEHMDELRDEEMTETSSEGEMEEVEEKEVFIREVIKSGYPEKLAKKALLHFKPDEIDDAVVWCMDHDDESDTEEAMDVTENRNNEQPELPSEEFKGWTNTPVSISTVTSELLATLEHINFREVRVDPLIKDLEKLWERFLTSISSSVSDYLSVEHLGLVLRCLASKETFAVRRHLIQSFKEGVPNLIICPQNDILNTVLTIYMNDRQEPLPQPDEVLVCSSHTTLDQLDIFWRRAVFNQSDQIYCLANSDLLDYEVSDKGEQCLEKHMQRAKDKGIKYKLVVLCSTENEYKSRIVAALERFRRPQLPVANQQLIKRYLQEKLKVDKTHLKTNPASFVDFGRSTVRVVKSWRAGVGKSLYKTRKAADLKELYPTSKRTTGAVVSIPLHEKEIDVDTIMARLLECTLSVGQVEPRIFHIDISYEVYIGVDAFLFQLLVLGCLINSAGYVWIKSPCDHYLVEAMPLLTTDNSKQVLSSFRGGEQICFHRCFEILPDVTCRSPEESMYILQGKKPHDYADSDLLFDKQEFESSVFQRPYQYLRRLDERRGLADINAYQPEGNQINCLQTFLRHCGVRDPSWAELKHFVCFLNSQLQDFEVSAFCGAAAKEDLPGFDKFVLKFLIQMSRDFATRSLVMSEESPIKRMQRLVLHDEETEGAVEDNIIEQFQMRRTWESSPHPYLFFNPDHHSMTFVGFKIQRATGDLMDQQTETVLEPRIMQRELQDSLIRNKVNIDENFDRLERHEKILKLCSVMGMDFPHDPDDTYELTTDNVKKILAIYMRFKCDIPVIIMGETGCGKTRLVKFMCALQCPPGVNLKNMILMKVHGGTRTKDIIKKVKEAEKIARENADTYGHHIQTVLFFDEANTTEAIGLIKEIMCDRTIGGNQLKLCRSLKIIAACNPYRKHSEELIKRLEQAGLGYHVDAEKTTDKLGRVPLRRLVYRVQPLPQSLLPLVWDFGQLDTRIEELYIRQMVLRYIRANKLPLLDNLENVVSKILTVSQDFMRQQKDECSFVSLRDVERVLEVMSWFYNQSQTNSVLFNLLAEENSDDDDDDDEEEEELMDEDEGQNNAQDITEVAMSLMLALGVCYHACLKKREEYRKAVTPHFVRPCHIPGPDPAQRMLEEIEKCQDVFLENVQLGKNIAHNQALKENVFMMVTCIELRIPLFLVGKPGSSKSLAKTVVNNAMQGHAAHFDLFRGYKEVQMMSYQCSPLSTPDGISGMFRQCAQFQKDKDLTRFVSVVVLDEVGLAEDSPRMPLKTLHPLLEDGCEGDETPEPYKKVAFIGISNWALDPAKMNRGILVQREVPELEELTLSAKGICQTSKTVYKLIKPLIPQMAEAYLELFQSALKMREFFGLRDFYSLLKMVYAFADKQKKKPSWHQMQHAIMRNFGGMDDINPVNVFAQVFTTVNITEKRKHFDPDCSPAGLIQACLTGDTNDR